MRATGLETVRHQLLLGLHFGRLRPGSRAPSVRRLAELTRLNLKTVHRAYTRLADEGLLEVRPGSGTFIADRLPGDLPVPLEELSAVVDAVRESADNAGVDPRVLADFVSRLFTEGVGDRCVAVTECNDEQLGLLALQLTTGLGLRTRAIRLSALRSPQHVPGGCHGVVTTECHRAEVVERLHGSAHPVYTLTFDDEFPRQVIQGTRSGPVVLIVHDTRFATVFRRLLVQLGADATTLSRVHVYEPTIARSLLAETSFANASVAVSPLVQRHWDRPLIRDQRSLGRFWQVEARALRLLEIRIAYDAALGATPKAAREQIGRVTRSAVVQSISRT